MSNEYIISIGSSAKLSIDISRVLVQTEEREEHIAVKDIAILVLESDYITLSAPVLSRISQAGGIVIGIDSSHLPSYMLLPIGVNRQGARRPHQQIEYPLGSAEQKKWWDNIIQAKINGQAQILEWVHSSHAPALRAYSKEVRNGDEKVIEGLAAKVYWQELFSLVGGSVKGRVKEGAGDIVNISLNYGYAILRAMVARALVGAGFCVNFGVGHYRKDNPFNLVEDFVEPFRPYIDKIVFSLFIEDKCTEEKMSPQLKKYILIRYYS